MKQFVVLAVEDKNRIFPIQINASSLAEAKAKVEGAYDLLSEDDAWRYVCIGPLVVFLVAEGTLDTVLLRPDNYFAGPGFTYVHSFTELMEQYIYIARRSVEEFAQASLDLRLLAEAGITERLVRIRPGVQERRTVEYYTNRRDKAQEGIEKARAALTRDVS